MPSNLQVDRRVVDRVEVLLRTPGVTIKQIYQEYPQLSLRWVYKQRDRLRAYGQCALPVETRGRRRKWAPEVLDALADYIDQHPTSYIDKTTNWLNEQMLLINEASESLSVSTIQRLMAQLKLTNKRTERQHPSRSDDLRTHYFARLSRFHAKQLIFVDESAVNQRTMDRRYRWSPRGVPCRVVLSKRYPDRWSLLPAIGINGYLYF